ncbi:MAG TPA: iron-containing alcohol dehydrogenase [Gemmataceae bacterium]|nr:iron-containing alcohol dehydrogenase [Gemmataceae bacterium]
MQPSVASSVPNASGVAPSGVLPGFDYQPRTRVVYAAGAVVRLGALVRELGGTRVLLVTDPGLEAAGHPQKALASLAEAGLDTLLFDGVEENPTTRHVQIGLEAARGHRADFLVAIGGGSAMDCAKGINFLLTNGGVMADYRKIGKAVRPMLPSIGIPTTAGTGSEAQSFAIIADEQSHMKMACGDPKAAFRVAILDPELTVSQPVRVTAVTGIDAVAHAVEAYVTTRRNPLSMTFAREAWRLLEPNLERVLKQPDNLPARGAMQLGAHFAGIAIESSMLGACHACANPLTAHYGITHGIAVGVMLPHVVRFNGPAVLGLYGDLAHEAGMMNGDLQAAGEVLAQRLSQLLRAASLPQSLRELGVSPGILSLLAEEASEQWTAQFNPRPAAQADLLNLYEAAF